MKRELILVIATLVLLASSLTAKAQFRKHQIEYRDAIQALRTVDKSSEKLQKKLPLVTAKCIAQIKNEKELAAALAAIGAMEVALQVIDEVEDSSEDALAGGHYGAYIPSVNKANGKELGFPNAYEAGEKEEGDPNYLLNAEDRVFHVVQALLLNEEIRILNRDLDTIEAAVLTVAIAADVHPIIFNNTKTQVANLVLASSKYAQTLPIWQGKVKPTAATIAALGLVNIYVGGFSGANFKDHFSHSRVHPSFKTQDLTFDLDFAQRRESGGKVYRRFEVGYQIPIGVWLGEDLVSRTGRTLVPLADGGLTFIAAVPGFNKRPAKVSYNSEIGMVEVSNFGLKLHVEKDPEHKHTGPWIDGGVVAGGKIVSGDHSTVGYMVEITSAPDKLSERQSDYFRLRTNGGNGGQTDSGFRIASGFFLTGIRISAKNDRPGPNWEWVEEDEYWRQKDPDGGTTPDN